MILLPSELWDTDQGKELGQSRCGRHISRVLATGLPVLIATIGRSSMDQQANDVSFNGNSELNQSRLCPRTEEASPDAFSRSLFEPLIEAYQRWNTFGTSPIVPSERNDRLDAGWNRHFSRNTD